MTENDISGKNIERLIHSAGPEVHIPPARRVEILQRLTDKTAQGDKSIWRIIMKSRITKLAAAAVIIIAVVFGIRTLSNLKDIDEPDTGVAVSKTDENNGTKTGAAEEVQLRQESEQIERMYAARDVDGLVKMLWDSQPASKVLAANYLAKIGDSRAIGALELLDAQSKDPDNPFGRAAALIKTRLEQDTLKTQPKDDNDVEVTSILPAEVNVVTLPASVNIAASGSVYDHFLFIRLNKGDGEGGTRTLVLAKVTSEGFEFRDINTQPVSRRPWEHPLCVVGGRLYAKHGEGELSGMNLATGQTEVLASDDDESVYSLLNVYGSHSYAYDDGRLYGQAGKDEDAMTLRVLDFRTRAYRDITTLERELEYTALALSPEHRHLAYFVPDPNGNLLTVVNVASGQVTYPTEPIRFVIPGISSLSWCAPPLVWVDMNRVVCIRSEVWGRGMDDAMNKVAVIDITTGAMEDIVSLPENPHARFFRMTEKYKLAGPRIRISNIGQFSIDLAERKLMEDDTLNGDYLVSDGYLFYREHELGGAIRWDGLKDLEISPDAKRAIWISEGKLFYHDSAAETAVPVTEDSNTSEGLLWLKAEDLQAQTGVGQMPAGWTAFKDRPPRSNENDDDDDNGCRQDRKDIKDHLVLTMQTDKNTYLLHEPIEVTLTFTSTTDANIEIASSRLIRLDMDCPGGSQEIECPVGPYEPNVETIVLGPGESITAADTLEIALPGDYKIKCEYERFEDPWRGEVKGDAAFTVNPVRSPDEEKRLFEAKFARLMARFRHELSTDYYDWSWFNALVRDEVVGMAGMGPNVAPYLAETLRQEQNGDVREWLYRALTPIAGAKDLPFFQERLAHGEAEPACQWLYDLYEKGQEGSAEALATLFSAMKHENADVRLKVAGELEGIYDPNVKALFETAIEDDNEPVRTLAARYLARAEWLDLDEWLDLAANEPTHARYIAARSIIKDLEEKWNVTKGRFPEATWKEASKNPDELEQFRKVVRAWQEWAGENLRFSSEFF